MIVQATVLFAFTYVSVSFWLSWASDADPAAFYKTLSAYPVQVNGDPRWIRQLRDDDLNDLKDMKDWNDLEGISRDPPSLPIAAVVVIVGGGSPRRRVLAGYRAALLTGAPWLLLVEKGGAGNNREGEKRGEWSEKEGEGRSPAVELLRGLQRPLEALFPSAVCRALPAGFHAAAAELLRGGEVPSLAAWRRAARGIAALHYDNDRVEEKKTSAGVPQEKTQTLAALLVEMMDDDTRRASAPLQEGSEGDLEEGEIVIYPDQGEMEEVLPASRDLDFVESDFVEEEMDWQFPRLWTPPHLPQRQYVLPGIVEVEITEKMDGKNPPLHHPDRVADKLQQLLEQSAIRRLARHQLRGRVGRSGGDFSANHTCPPHGADKDALWLLKESYGVVFVGSIGEQYRIQLLYQRVFNAARKAAWQRLCQLIATLRGGSPNSTEGGAPPSGDTSLFSSLPGRSLATRIFVFPVIAEPDQNSFPNPLWLPYNNELPLDAPTNSYRITRCIASYSHYLYKNYRQWMDSMLVATFSLRQMNYMTIVHELVADFMDGRIDRRDILHFVEHSFHRIRLKRR
ncbi:unnamed protein product [Phytomonas sp. EM1]|nr:unnamed protein product [Phytomonas sp. EM1]|eukprot:CCW62486.1 unnamed protein product [Phytomonas sp. isolate EM1]